MSTKPAACQAGSYELKFETNGGKEADEKGAEKEEREEMGGRREERKSPRQEERSLS